MYPPPLRTQLLLMLRNFRNKFSMSSSGLLGDEEVTSMSHRGEMSDIKTQVGRGCVKDWFSQTTTVSCRQRVSVSVSFPLMSMVLLLLSLVTPALSIHMESVESHSEFSCEPIKLRMCQDLPYNTTFMPNLLNHYDQQTAALAMEVGCLCVCVIQAVHAACISITAHGDI